MTLNVQAFDDTLKLAEALYPGLELLPLADDGWHKLELYVRRRNDGRLFVHGIALSKDVSSAMTIGLKWELNREAADSYSRTHVRDKGAPAAWCRCCYVRIKDGALQRCVGANGHPGSAHEEPKP